MDTINILVFNLKNLPLLEKGSSLLILDNTIAYKNHASQSYEESLESEVHPKAPRYSVH